MRTTLTSVVIIALMLFMGCETAPIADRSVKLSMDSVTLMAGNEYEISVLSDGNYELLDENPEIASGWWVDEKTIVIKTHSVGTARIWIKDTDDSRNDFAIKVNSKYFQGIFCERIYGPPVDRVQILVLTEDDNVKKKIEDELLDIANKRYYAIYKFKAEDNSVIVDFSGCPTIKDGQKYKGIYQWEPDGDLIMEYNGVTEKYMISQVPGRPSRFYLVQNETEKYQKLFPDTKIYRVSQTRIISTNVR